MIMVAQVSSKILRRFRINCRGERSEVALCVQVDNVNGSSDILVRKLIFVRVLIQFDKNNFCLVLVLVRQKVKILVLI